MMRCLQCGTETPDDEWNCAACRVNLYWAHQHYAELARIREQQGLTTSPSTPPFLIEGHQREMGNRARRGLQVENKVRAIARRVIRGHSTEQP
jgi:hypothetical protein